MIHINDLTIRVAGRDLLKNATAAIPEGARVGMVGRNGTGKTTLFKAIAGDIAPDDGSINIPKGRRLGRVAQEAPSGPESLIETVLKADIERAALLAEADVATDPHRIAEIQTRLIDIDAHSAPARAARILAGLGFDAEAQQRPCSSFSGGWRMRVALAAVLFSEPDLLLLDEPTNHLDLEGTLWLQDYLARYPRTVIIISHDRDLLDVAVDHILNLTDQRLVLYRGNYSSFDKQRQEKLLLDQKLKKKQEDERAHLEAFIARFKAKASKAKQAQSRVKRLEKMEIISLAADPDARPFHLPGPDRPLAPPMIAFDQVNAGYGDHVVLRKLNMTLGPEDRVGLLGSNGNGKSTLAKLLAGSLAPLTGDIRRSSKMVAGYFAQHTMDSLVPEQSPYDHVRALMPGATEAQVRARVGRIGFSGERAMIPVSSLSGGEKARVALGLAAFDKSHLLILDEPTNHLDIDSRDRLVEAVNAFSGAVVLISHDRHLIEACVDQFWLVAEGGVTPFDGDLDDYRRLIMAREDGGPAKKNHQQPEPAQSGVSDEPAGGAALRKRVSDLEAKIAKLERDIAKFEADLAAAEDWKRAGLLKKRDDAAAQLARIEEEWLEANAAYEAQTVD
ncbi:ATP-binding protein [Agaricicola taiwanensis]|uniref:ATP-binding protein n=1 Tax=Agaricicola taiwanensis TaxID=591372 RepID=A0A8J3DV07_9RHOB|nr:ABC-F family ATP-binding cassette domain-containing protein [Agaricicola taiwanensis]GGE46808.1 ATP-binding protein [Agaricicola taiwanensis]